jgi:hypothetical protein
MSYPTDKSTLASAFYFVASNPGRRTVFALWMLIVLSQICGAQSVVSVTSLGAHSNGTNAAATTAAFKNAFATNPTGEILVPPGTYLIDNSGGALMINNFSGQLEFQGSAQLIFTTNTIGGLLFVGGTGAVIDGLQATYATPPTHRNSPNEEIKFSGTTNTTLTNTTVQNSPSAGILFFDSVNPKVVNATVFNTLADGLNFSNCQNALVTNLTTQNTGDDALSILNYAQYPNLTGALAQNISITNSQARGIAVVGQSNVIVNGFQIQGTSSSGVLVAQDPTFNTRFPANVVIENGAVYNAGTLPPLVGSQYGLEYSLQQNVMFSNIYVFGSGTDGFAGSSPNGKVSVNNVTVDSPLSGHGFLFDNTQSVQVTSSTAINTPSYGFVFFQSSQIIATGGLTAINTGTTDPLKRAIWFEDAQTILASSLNVFSNAGSANVIGCYTDAGYSAPTGSVKTISTEIVGSTLSIQNSCPNVKFTP